MSNYQTETKQALKKLANSEGRENEALEKIAQAILALNKPAIEVTDITAMTKEQLDALEVGDKVVKVTGVQKHLYFVTYKGAGAGQGICLSYNDAGYGETVAYDRTDDGWVFNSVDVKTYGD